MNMNKLTLKLQLKMMIGIVVFALFTILYGVRLMGKANEYSYLEHQHSQAISIANIELSKNKINRSKITIQVKSAYEAAIGIDDVIFDIEKFFFRFFNQGWLIDLAVDSESNLKKGIFIIENIKEPYSISKEKKTMDLIMNDSLDLSSKFDLGLKELSTTIRYFTNILIILCVGVLILFILNILRKTIPPLEEIALILKKISRGDLKVEVNKNTSGEVGSIQFFLEKMTGSLQEMIRNIHFIVDELILVADKSTEITNQTIDGIKTQKSETESLLYSIREMSVAVNEIATSASNAALAATNGDKAADKGKKIVVEAVESINELAVEVEASVVAVQRIEVGSEKIGSVLKIIKNITAQTNLLGLNAAIEAAHAGEYGKGFSVVADQVKVLAEQTEHSTIEIQGMIKELSNSTQAAVEIMAHSHEQALSSVEKAQQTGDAINVIVEEVSTITMMNDQIASAAEEQGVVTSEITGNTEVINDISEKAEIGGDEVAESNKSVIEMLDKLSSVIQKFDI